MNKEEKEFNDKFMNSTPYNEWHESINDIIDYMISLIQIYLV